MEVGTLTVKLRSNIGSGFSRRRGASGRFPPSATAVAIRWPLQVVPADLQKSLDPKKGRNTLLRLNVEGTKKDQLTVLVKDASATRCAAIWCMSTSCVQLDKPVKATVPLHLVGKAGRRQGRWPDAPGLSHHRPAQPPDKIPTHIDLDVTA